MAVSNMDEKSTKQKEIDCLVDDLLVRKAYTDNIVFDSPPHNTHVQSQYSSTVDGSIPCFSDTECLVENQQTAPEQKSGMMDLTEKYRLIALHTSDLIAFTTFDMNPTFTFVSPSHKKILGYSEDDLLGQSGLNYIHADDSEKLLTVLLAYFEAKIHNTLTFDMLNTAQKIDLRFRDKSGEWHLLQSTVDIVKNELLFVSKDITEQKKVQEACAESERKFRNLYDNLRDGFASVGLDGKITECNAAFVSMLGYSFEELRLLTSEEITPFKWHDFERRILEDQVKKRGYSDLYEKEYIHKNKTHFPIEIQTYAIYDNNKVHSGYWIYVRDITSRKKMDMEQKENQDHIKAIVMNAPIGISVSGQDRLFISANGAFCKILGYTERELQKMSFRDITHREDIENSNRMVEDLRTGRIPYFIQEKRYIKKDGNIIVGRVIVSAIRNQEGIPSLYVAELEDITEKKQMDQALKKSEEKFVKAFQSSPIAICITRLSDGKFVEVNDSFEKLSGYSRPELMAGSSIAFKLWMNDSDRNQVVDQLMKTGSVHDSEYQFRNKAGNILIIRYSGEMLYLNEERCCLSALVDITNLKKLDESLRESEEKYRSIVENTQDVIMLTKTSGHVEYISPACFNVLGYNPHDVIGKIFNITYPDDVEKANSFLSKALQGVPGSNFEYRIITKNGTVRWISHSWAPIITNDMKLKFIVSIIRNITDSKHTEQNLKLKIEELERYKNITVNREIKMMELKKENMKLKDVIKELQDGFEKRQT